MRRRSTFIPAPDVDYDPTEVKVDGDHVSFAGLKAAREEKFTFGLRELPAELVDVLQNAHELHVRWTSEDAFEKRGPYLSSLTPGLHVHYTPGSKQNDVNLCPLLKQVFSADLRCESANESFTRPDILSERFTSAAALQFHSRVPSLSRLVAWLQKNICDASNVVCRHDVALLNLADYVDFDFDSISHALTITAYWSKPPAVLMDPIGEWTTYDHWNLAVDGLANDRNEIGILRTNPGQESAQLQMEGFLTVVGEDSAPKPTMFFFPSRHHSLSESQRKNQQYQVTFDSPTGLHPTMRISFSSGLGLVEPADSADDSTCGLHAYLTLPSVLFADEYAFPTTDFDPLFTEAHNILSMRSLSGERDLEAPDYVIKKWGSALLLELATPEHDTNKSSTPWGVTVPLHLRYLEPTQGGLQDVTIPWPILFWACTSDEGTKFTVNPFDRVNLGYDGLFGPRTMFYHLEPQVAKEQRLIETLRVPVLDTTQMSFGAAELSTMALVIGGFLWVAWTVVREISMDLRKQGSANKKTAEKKVQ